MYNDSTNVFDVVGFSGAGPGNHTRNENLTTQSITDICNSLNNLNKLCVYQSLLPNRHLGFFFGSIDFTYTDSTLIGYLTENISNYGILLPYDMTTTVVDVYSTDLSCLEIPLNTDLVLDHFSPACMTTLIKKTDGAEYRYTPSIYQYNDIFLKSVYIRFSDFSTQTWATSTFYQTLGDYRLHIFGIFIANEGDL